MFAQNMYLQLLVNTRLFYCMLIIIVQHKMDATEQGVLTLICVFVMSVHTFINTFIKFVNF